MVSLSPHNMPSALAHFFAFKAAGLEAEVVGDCAMSLNRALANLAFTHGEEYLFMPQRLT